MIEIQFTRNGEIGTKRVQRFALESTLRSFRAAGYEILSDGTAPVEPATETETTGRVGKGTEVHRIIGGGAHCGSSYRRGLKGNLEVKITGEPITCSKCKG